MNYKYLIIIFLVSLLFIFLYRVNQIRKNSLFIYRFKQSFKTKDFLQRKNVDYISDYMMSEPSNNLIINNYDDERIIRAKVDIHKTRLKKYGYSKLNGETIYKEETGGKVFKYIGNKKEYL